MLAENLVILRVARAIPAQFVFIELKGHASALPSPIFDGALQAACPPFDNLGLMLNEFYRATTIDRFTIRKI